jgi:hypothetical protein
MKTLQKKIRVSTFGCDVLLMLTDNVYLSEKRIHKKYDTKEVAIEEGTAEGVSISVNFQLYVIILDIDRISHNLIGHEVFHVVSRIAGDREITDEETMAWLMGFMLQEIHNFIDKKKNARASKPSEPLPIS